MEASKKKKKKKNPSSPFASIDKREAKRKKLVHRDPGLLNVQDALEHIIATGAKVRRDNWRRQEFDNREENRSTPDALGCPPFHITTDTRAATIYSSRQLRAKQNNSSETVVCHAEDLRIYGNQNSHLPPFTPKTTPSGKVSKDGRRSDDSEWNFEHGDSIPPIIFRIARLSEEYPLEEESSRFNGPKATQSKSFTSTDVTLEERDVPRALIEKCWERAVHIASNALVVPVAVASETVEPETLRDARSSNQPSSSLPFDSNMSQSQESYREKCQSLGVDIESLRAKSQSIEALSETTCPRCTRSFSTTDELLRHFYGTADAIGCCEALIRPRHLDLIRNLLQTYVESQTYQLGDALLSQGAVSDRYRTRHQKYFTWRDVRWYMEQAVENSTLIPKRSSSSHPRTDARHPVQQSMHMSSGTKSSNVKQGATNSHASLPLMLNPMVLEAVNRRLIDRYADVPP